MDVYLLVVCLLQSKKKHGFWCQVARVNKGTIINEMSEKNTLLREGISWSIKFNLKGLKTTCRYDAANWRKKILIKEKWWLEIYI